MKVLKVIIFSILTSACQVSIAANEELEGLTLKELLSLHVDQQESLGVFSNQILPANTSTINIGLLLPFGTEKTTSSELLNAAELAATEINQQGGVVGKKIAVIAADDNGKLNTGVILTKRLIDEYRIDFLIGPMSSNNLAGIVTELSNTNRLPIFAPSANANSISHLKDNDLVFRLSATNQQITNNIIQFIENYKLKKIAIFHQRDIFGNEIAEGIRQALEKSDANLLFSKSLSEQVDYQTYDLKQDIKTLQTLEIDLIVFSTIPAQFTPLAEQLSAHWQGQIPKILLPEYGNVSLRNSVILRENLLCVYAVVPQFSEQQSPVLNGINRSLNVPNSSYTAQFIYDLVYLGSGALAYSQLNKVDFSQALRKITQPGKTRFSALDFPSWQKLFEQHPLLSFAGTTGAPNFDQYGDNLNINLKTKLVSQPNKTQCGNSHE